MATSDLTGVSSAMDHPALRLELAAVLRKAAGHYTAAAAEAAGRGDHTRAAVYTARAEQNRAEAAKAAA